MLASHFAMKRALASVTAALAWGALAVQMVYTVRYARAAGESFVAAVHGFFSFFTAATNLFVALVLTVPLVVPRGRFGRWCSDPRTTTSAATSIIIVGVVYHVLLSAAYNPVGVEFVTDVCLHYLVPGLYATCWFLYAPKRGLRYVHVPTMLIYPAGYGVHTFVRGALTGKYPYFFLDVNRLGLSTATRNVAGLLVVFVVVATMLLLITTRQRRTQAADAQER